MEKRKLEKEDLEPGMKVRNKISNNTGMVRADEDGGLTGGLDWVGVTTQYMKGKKKGHKFRATWLVRHLEIVS